jgi:hypothetical protein
LIARILDGRDMNLVEGLAGHIAKALGAPLTILTLTAEQMERRPGCSTRAGESARSMLVQSRRLEKIRELLVDAANPGEAMRQVIDVNQAITEVVALVAGQLELDRVETVVDLDPVAIRSMGDPLRFKRAILDLLGIDEEGGTCAGGWSRVLIRTRQHDRTAEITVAYTSASAAPPESRYLSLSIWTDDGSAGRLWRAWQFAHLSHGEIEVRASGDDSTEVIMRWPSYPEEGVP